MILHIPKILTCEQVRTVRTTLERAAWVDGRVTAGDQSGSVKHNLQLSEDDPEARRLGDLVLKALAASPLFMSAALPLKVYPPLFNRYGEGMGFGDHIDNAIRVSPITGARYRTDLSATLFLAEPDEYDGGALLIEDGSEPRRVKLAAGDLALYPATTVHRVEPITRGQRLASFFWIQSMVGDEVQRDLLCRMDRAIASIRAEVSDEHPGAVALTGAYHNLVRMWARL
jgi:PKHD-type hydroxylase